MIMHGYGQCFYPGMGLRVKFVRGKKQIESSDIKDEDIPNSKFPSDENIKLFNRALEGEIRGP